MMTKQLLKLSTILFVAGVLSSCKEGPDVTLCVSQPENGGFLCNKKEVFTFVKYKDSKGYFAVNTNDMQTLVTYCGLNGDK